MAYSVDMSSTLDDIWATRSADGTFCHKIEIDTSATNLGAALHKVTAIPAGTFIQGVIVYCTTVEGATATIDVGDHTDADTAIDIDGWIDGANLNSLVATSTGQAATTEEYASGKYYPATKDLTITVNNALDAAIFELFIFGRHVDGRVWEYPAS